MSLSAEPAQHPTQTSLRAQRQLSPHPTCTQDAHEEPKAGQQRPETLKQNKDGGEDVFHPTGVPGKGDGAVGWTTQGEEESRGLSKLLIPWRRKTPQKNHISGEFCRQVFGKVGELGTQRTYPSGRQINVSHGCPITALSTCFTTLALLLAQRPPPQDGRLRDNSLPKLQKMLEQRVVH